MIIDNETLLSNAQAITQDAASEDIYDTGSDADVGPGRPLQLFCSIDEAFNTLTSLDIILQTDSDEAFGSAKDLWKVNVPLAGLTLNAKIDLPPVPAGAERYLRLYYDVDGSNPSTGKVTAGILLDDQRNTPTAGA